MTVRDCRVRARLRAVPRAVAWAALLLLFAVPSHARPRLGAELMVQHVREDTDGLLDPEHFPVSGGGTLTLRWKAARRIDLVTGLGYEDRATLGRFEVSVFDFTFSGGIQRQWRSLVLPLHARIPIGRIVRFEVGPEWRWLLQARSRGRNETLPFASARGPLRAQSDIFERGYFSEWIDGTGGYDRSTFALSAGLGLHRGWQGGDAGLGLRWCESLGNQFESEEFRSHFREFQLALSWER